MNRQDIIRLRLCNQSISLKKFETPHEIVSYFGAIQSQDFSMALWAIGLRMKLANRNLIEKSISSGNIIRTHILRPTWHFVHKNDVRWMMELSADNVKKANKYIDKKEGLTDDLFHLSWKIIERKFKEIESVSKEEIMACLADNKLKISNLLATQIIMRAELEMYLCNGEKKGTYSLFDERIPQIQSISRAEALSKLTFKYFISRGPATLNDFVWWSGLSVKEAKIGISMWNKELVEISYEKLKYYFFEPNYQVSEKKINALLPCFDEFTVGYAEGRNLLFHSKFIQDETGNGIFKPIILSDNEIIGMWRKIPKIPFVYTTIFKDLQSYSDINLKDEIEEFILFNSAKNE